MIVCVDNGCKCLCVNYSLFICNIRNNLTMFCASPSLKFRTAEYVRTLQFHSVSNVIYENSFTHAHVFLINSHSDQENQSKFDMSGIAGCWPK